MASDRRFLTTRRTEHGAARAACAGLTLFALLTAIGCASASAPPPRAKLYETYRVGAPDEVHIVVLPDPPIERSVRVRPDGMISLDLIGDVPAGGRTVEEIADDIQKRIGRFKRGAQVTVSVVMAESHAITVLGEVRGPRSFPLVKETRAAEAIGLVGGTTNFASRGKIRVIRSAGGETSVYKVDLPAIQAGDLSTNILLTTGDIVYVPPTILARIGYAIQMVLFPFQPLLGVAQTVAGNQIL